MQRRFILRRHSPVDQRGFDGKITYRTVEIGRLVLFRQRLDRNGQRLGIQRNIFVDGRPQIAFAGQLIQQVLQPVAAPVRPRFCAAFDKMDGILYLNRIEIDTGRTATGSAGPFEWYGP